MIQTGIVLNSLRNHGSDIQKIDQSLQAAILSFDCIPLLQGLQAAYREFEDPPPGQRGYKVSQAERQFWFNGDLVVDYIINALKNLSWLYALDDLTLDY